MPSRIIVPGASIARISRRRASSTGSAMTAPPAAGRRRGPSGRLWPAPGQPNGRVAGIGESRQRRPWRREHLEQRRSPRPASARGRSDARDAVDLREEAVMPAARRVLERPARVQQHEVRRASVRLRRSTRPSRWMRWRRVRNADSASATSASGRSTPSSSTRGAASATSSPDRSAPAGSAAARSSRPPWSVDAAAPPGAAAATTASACSTVSVNARVRSRGERRRERGDDVELCDRAGSDAPTLSDHRQVLPRRTDLGTVTTGALRVRDDRAECGDQRTRLARQRAARDERAGHTPHARVELVVTCLLLGVSGTPTSVTSKGAMTPSRAASA
jgi:hypothetical protein